MSIKADIIKNVNIAIFRSFNVNRLLVMLQILLYPSNEIANMDITDVQVNQRVPNTSQPMMCSTANNDWWNVVYIIPAIEENSTANRLMDVNTRIKTVVPLLECLLIYK